MLRTLINICDREYLFGSYLFPTTFFSLLRKWVSSLPLFVPIPGISDSAGIYTGHVNHLKSLYFCLLPVLLWPQPLFLCFGKGAFHKDREACTIHQEGKSFTKSHHFSSLALAFYNIADITVMLKGQRHKHTLVLFCSGKNSTQGAERLDVHVCFCNSIHLEWSHENTRFQNFHMYRSFQTYNFIIGV